MSARGIGPAAGWRSTSEGADIRRASEADGASNDRPLDAHARRRLPTFATVPRHAVLQRRLPPRRPARPGTSQSDWSEGEQELGAEETQAPPTGPTSRSPGSDLDDARQQGRRRYNPDTDDADVRNPAASEKGGVGDLPSPLQRARSRRAAPPSSSTATGSERQASINAAAARAPVNHAPPQLAGFDKLFGADSQISHSQRLESLARYALAVLRHPEDVRRAGWTRTSLWAYAARRVVDLTPKGEPAPSFKAIQAALVAASADVPSSAGPSEPTQDLSVLLPLLLWNCGRHRTDGQTHEASARLQVLAAASAKR